MNKTEVTIHTGNEGRNGALQICITNSGADLATDEQEVEIRFWLRPLHMTRDHIAFSFHAGVASALAENHIAFRVLSDGSINISTNAQYRAEIWA